MSYDEAMKDLVQAVGGKENIDNVTHCTTRLRFNLKDDQLVDQKKVENNDAVLGTANSGGQYQVIIGTTVEKAYNSIVKIVGVSNNKGNEDKEKDSRNIFSKIIDAIVGSMAPVVPAVIGCSMIKLLLIILPQIGVLSDTGTTYRFLQIIGDGGFYFLPLLVAASASRKFGTNLSLSLAIVAILVHPDLLDIFEEGIAMNIFGIPVTEMGYTYSVIPAIIMVWLMSYIEKGVDKITPTVTKNFLSPLLVLLISGAIALTIVGPAGGWAGEVVASGILTIYESTGWFSVAIIGVFWNVFVMLGMHHVFTPVIITSLASGGFEGMIMVGALAANLAQAGACLAVALRTKNKKMKQTAGVSGASVLIGGITEPALYGVTLPLRRPLIASMIGGGIAGAFAGIMQIVAYSQAAPSLVTTLQYIDGENMLSILWVAITCALSIGITFVLTLILGFKEEANSTGAAEVSAKSKIVSPLKGEVIELSQIKDAVFSEELAGKGIAIIPDSGEIYSPVNAVVTVLPSSKHAIGLKTENGIELLIHVGIDTVELNGEYFENSVNVGDQVKEGDLLLNFNINKLREKGFEISTPIVITNSNEYKTIETKKMGAVQVGEDILHIDK
ncbi:beta-glucoside-specific PTS transporter subunit IIABC [Oceanobacillus oncorhynchi subsp. oncorhynchi]